MLELKLKKTTLFFKLRENKPLTKTVAQTDSS